MVPRLQCVSGDDGAVAIDTAPAPAPLNDVAAANAPTTQTDLGSRFPIVAV